MRLVLLWSGQGLSLSPFVGEGHSGSHSGPCLTRHDLEQGSQAAAWPCVEYSPHLFACGLSAKNSFYSLSFIFKWSKTVNRRILFHDTWSLYGFRISGSIDKNFKFHQQRNVAIFILSYSINTSLLSLVLPLGPQSLKYVPFGPLPKKKMLLPDID